MYVYTYVVCLLFVCVCVCVFVCVCVCVCVCVWCLYIRMYVHMYVHACQISSYIHTYVHSAATCVPLTSQSLVVHHFLLLYTDNPPSYSPQGSVVQHLMSLLRGCCRVCQSLVRTATLLTPRMASYQKQFPQLKEVCTNVRQVLCGALELELTSQNTVDRVVARVKVQCLWGALMHMLHVHMCM